MASISQPVPSSVEACVLLPGRSVQHLLDVAQSRPTSLREPVALDAGDPDRHSSDTGSQTSDYCSDGQDCPPVGSVIIDILPAPDFDGPPFAVVKIPGKGEGMLAVIDLEPGDHILTEKALMTCRSDQTGYYRLVWMLSELTEAERASFMALHNCKYDAEGNPTGPEILGIWYTNCFGVDDSSEAIIPGISKLNHSCQQNVTRSWDSETQSMSIYACDYIYRGEELTHSYIDLFQPAQDRRDFIKRSWGFDCSCATCDLPRIQLVLSDKRRARLRELRDTEKIEKNRNPKQLDLIVEALDLLQEEGLFSFMWHYSMLGITACVDRTRYDEALWWAGIAAEHACCCYGPSHPTVRMLRSWAVMTPDQLRQACATQSSSWCVVS